MSNARRFQINGAGGRQQSYFGYPRTRQPARPYSAEPNPRNFRPWIICAGFSCLILLGVAVIIIAVTILLSVRGQVQEAPITVAPAPADCLLQCEQGTPNTECSKCICEGSALTGSVTDPTQRPLSGAIIADADAADKALAITDNSGSFRVDGFCPVIQAIVIRKDNYLTVVEQTVVQNSVTSTLDVVLSQEDRPYFVEHPVNKLRVIGDNVALCCKANGNPPAKYEWFKGDNPLYVSGETLILASVTLSDSGSYRCQAKNAAGSLFSNSAQLNVKGGFETCDRKPMENSIQLPSTCVQSETNSATYNAGICRPFQCGLVTDHTRCQDQYCCQVDEQEVVQLQCQGYTMSVTKITTCKCALCLEDVITVAGAVEIANNGGRVQNINVYVNDKEVATTDSVGRYSFTLSSQNARVPVTFKDGQAPRRVLDTTKILKTTTSLNIYQEIEVLPVPKPITLTTL